jgi:excisionase family DNA binding protein
MLGKSQDWTRRAAARGDIPSLKVGRSRLFTQADLESYLERCRQVDPWARSARSQARRRRSGRDGHH